MDTGVPIPSDYKYSGRKITETKNNTMFLRLAAVVLVAFVATALGKSVKDALALENMITADPDDELGPRVIGGRDAYEDEFPWMVALHYQGRFVCSSFLITPNFLMTAAHCVVFGREPEDPKHYNGYAGTLNRDGPDTELLFTEIIAHEEYGSDTEYDIALMRLATPVKLSDKIQTICLPTNDSFYQDMKGQVMGWGVSDKNGREAAKTLQTAEEDIPTWSRCNMVYGILGIKVTNRHVCAGGTKDKGICFGDSGGPLVAMNETKPIAIGIASFGSFMGCAVEMVPAVYTATWSYNDWIVEKMGKDADDVCFLEKTSESTQRWWG